MERATVFYQTLAMCNRDKPRRHRQMRRIPSRMPAGRNGRVSSDPSGKQPVPIMHWAGRPSSLGLIFSPKSVATPIGEAA